MVRPVTRSFSAAAARPSPSRTPSAPSVPPATSRPTAEFERHHAVTPPKVDAQAFRQGWRVATRLDALLEAGRIDREAWDAAQDWRCWFETVTPFRAQAWDVRVDVSTVPTDAGMLYRVAAMAKLRAVADALGPLRVKLLELVVVKDLSWLELARVLRVSDKTAVGFAVEALEALADHLGGRVVAAPPVLRFRNEPGRL